VTVTIVLFLPLAVTGKWEIMWRRLIPGDVERGEELSCGRKACVSY
jgi:hypothetical protein